MKKFLITTALEETWADNKPVVFLGEWCRLYSRRDRWSKMDAELLPYHWDDQAKFFSDYQYLSDLYERLLMTLTHQLNQIHSVNKDLRYWRILVGPWLADFIQILFDRWSSIMLAKNHFEISETIILTGQEDALVPNDVRHFAELMIEDDWNHHIYGLIIEQFTNIPSIKKIRSNCVTPPMQRKRNFKHKLMAGFTNLASCFVKDRDAFLIQTYLPKFNEMRLHRRLGQVPLLWKPVQPVRIAVDWRQREWDMTLQGKTDFEKCVLALIPKQIPVLFLEGYKQLLEQTQKQHWPRNPKLIFTSSVIWYDTVPTAYIAEKVMQGTPLVYGQHGGVYGVAQFTWAEEHEVAVSDRYLTWGWSDPARPKIKPLGILKVPCVWTRRSSTGDKLLLIALDSPRFTYRLSSESLTLSNAYINNSFLFTNALPKDVRENLIVRLTSSEYGWNQSARWRDCFPGVELDLGRYRMNDLLKKARLVVYTYNSTGYLEAFARNVPAILFFDPKVSPLRDSAVSYFDDLKRVGIFHDNPESAAHHVNSIWCDVDAWWNSVEVQEVLEKFKKSYCYLPDDPLGKVIGALGDVIADCKDKTTTVGVL